MAKTGTTNNGRSSILWALALYLLLCLPSASHAAKTIGMILPRDCAVGADAKDKFVQMLFESGMSSGDVEVFVQRPSPDMVSRLNSARKFLSFGVDVIVVWGGTSIDEILRESGKIPVVFVGVYDPVRQGIVRDLKAPGKNTTGVASTTSLAFLLDNILEVTGGGNLGVVAKGLTLIPLDAAKAKAGDLADVLAPAPFLYLAQGCYVEAGRFANMEKLGKPAATQTPGITSGGVVFTLAPSIEGMLNEAAGITATILKGEKASGIPVVRMRKIDFVINMAEARKLGLKIPFPVLNRATKVIK
jgi:putative ABC transport system substrate-binding protein